VTAALAESAAEAMGAKEAALSEANLAFTEGAESAAEAREAALGEQGIIRQLNTVRFDSLEALSARNDAALLTDIGMNVEFSNFESGTPRADAFYEELLREYTESDGYHIERERSLLDETGRKVFDPETLAGRRVDFVAIRNGEVVKSFEVTSESVDKEGQTAKEARVREAGGNFVWDRESRELVPFAEGVKTEVKRRP